jgi:glycosyltransferase involved in cell wall biosynthesis
MYSLIIPVYRNEASVPELLEAIGGIDRALASRLEAVFVVDGSPDASYVRLLQLLPATGLRAKLVLLSRNFGSFAAIRAGLQLARGPWFAVMAADLQEPPQLMLDFFRTLEHEPVDVVLGERATRSDPWFSRLVANTFWWLYRRLVQKEIPPGGVDVFGCNEHFRDCLLRLTESNSSLVGQIFWLGFRRKLFPYHRLQRRHGASAWTFARKLRYLGDSLFAFSDLPIRALLWAGLAGLVLSIVFGIVVIIARLSGAIALPGYAATVLTITFFAALNSFALGILGSYTWRAYENTKQRPASVVLMSTDFAGKDRST